MKEKEEVCPDCGKDFFLFQRTIEGNVAFAHGEREGKRIIIHNYHARSEDHNTWFNKRDNQGSFNKSKKEIRGKDILEKIQDWMKGQKIKSFTVPDMVSFLKKHEPELIGSSGHEYIRILVKGSRNFVVDLAGIPGRGKAIYYLLR